MHLKGLNSKIFRGRPPGPPAVGPLGGFAPQHPSPPNQSTPFENNLEPRLLVHTCPAEAKEQIIGNFRHEFE